jgi:hypothetical protein
VLCAGPACAYVVIIPRLITRHKKEKGIFYGHTAAGFMALEDKDQCKLTSNYKDLKGRAEIESGKEAGKRSLLRSAKEQAGRGAVLRRTRGLQ